MLNLQVRGVAAAWREEVRRDLHRRDIVAYARDRHGVWLWRRQREIVEAVAAPGSRVMIESANAVGKTMLMGLLIAWFHDCFDPGIGIATAPKFEQIKRTTFKEARGFLAGRPGLMPQNPCIYSGPRHNFTGFTSNGATSFQGDHEQALMLLFEEATGIPAGIWTAARSMLAGGENTFWVAALNPTDSTSAAYLEADSGEWQVFRVSAFEHPNIAAELCGVRYEGNRHAPIDGAVRLRSILSNMIAWGDRDLPYSDHRRLPTDVDLWDWATYGFRSEADLIEVDERGTLLGAHQVVEAAMRTFPHRYWAPGPEGFARICGTYPGQSSYAIFNKDKLATALGRDREPEWTRGVTFGCDVARFGDDATCIHGRVHMDSVHHEQRHRQDTRETADRLKQLCREFALRTRQRPWDIPCLIDDTGLGGGVYDQRHADEHLEDGSKVEVCYRFVPVNMSQSARDPEAYPNARSEMLFDLADLVGTGETWMGRIGKEAGERLSAQAGRLTYTLDTQGRRVAETKKEQKRRIGRSPDDLDGAALAYYSPSTGAWGDYQGSGDRSPPDRPRTPQDGHSASYRKHLGRR